MTAYIGVERFKTMRTGADLTGVSDAEIAENLEDASEIVDAFCLAPIGPQPFSFLGGSVVGEQLPWRYPEAWNDRGSRRVYPSHQPVLEVTSFRLKVGAEADASIPVETIVINSRERWIEVTAASLVNSSGLFGVSGWIVPFGGLMQPMAVLDYSYGESFPFDRERANAVTSTIYQTSAGQWTSDAVSVYVGGVLTTTGFTLDRLEGRVIFGSAPSGVVEVTYATKLRRAIPRACGRIAGVLLTHGELMGQIPLGLRRITDGEISIERQSIAQTGAEDFVRTYVPDAALMLEGHRIWTMA